MLFTETCSKYIIVKEEKKVFYELNSKRCLYNQIRNI